MWKKICPPLLGIFDLTEDRSGITASTDNVCLKSQTAQISIGQQELYARMEIAFYNKNKRPVTFVSASHTLTVTQDGISLDGKSVFSVTIPQDNKKQYIWELHLVSGSLFELTVDGVALVSYEGDVLGGETVDAVEFYGSSGWQECFFYWGIFSDSPVSRYSKIITLTPTVTGDWEKNDNGSYTATEAGKTMHLSVPEDGSELAGYKVIAAAPILSDAIGNDTVPSVEIKTDAYDKTYSLPSEKSEIGFEAGGGDIEITSRG